jgi:hypothetical protein
MHGLTPSERRVARKLLADYPVAGLTTVAELAELRRVCFFRNTSLWTSVARAALLQRRI